MLTCLIYLQVVGEGFHPKAGMPHAEVYALRGAGEDPLLNLLNGCLFHTCSGPNHESEVVIV